MLALGGGLSRTLPHCDVFFDVFCVIPMGSHHNTATITGGGNSTFFLKRKITNINGVEKGKEKTTNSQKKKKERKNECNANGRGNSCFFFFFSLHYS